MTRSPATAWYNRIVALLPAKDHELRDALSIGINEAHRYAASEEFDVWLAKLVKMRALIVGADGTVRVARIDYKGTGKVKRSGEDKRQKTLGF